MWEQWTKSGRKYLPTGNSEQNRKEVPAVVKHMKETLHSTTLYKSGDATYLFCSYSTLVLFNEIRFRKIPLTVLSYEAIQQP